MPIFRLKMAFGVGRGVKAFFGLYGGATRGDVPDPWRQNAPGKLREKDMQIYRLKNKIKGQREDIFRLTNKLEATNGLAKETPEDPSAPQVSGDATGALPDFVVIGAMRCGTSRFYALLTRHPYVKHAAAKELHYFDQWKNFNLGIGWYRQNFPPPEHKDGRSTITGEATPRYLFDPMVPERMAQQVPDARLIVLLRNPVDRAYSQYHRSVSNGTETRSFQETVEGELALPTGAGSSGHEGRTPVGNKNLYNQLARGIYVDQLARWREFFDEEQMLVIKSEDFFKHTADTLKQTQDFLRLPHREIELSPHKTDRQASSDYEPMNPEMRERLEAFFEPHNRRLYDFLSRDFGW